MAFNGSGLYQRIHSWVADRNNGVKIRADRVDAEFDEVAAGLSNCMTRDGQSKVTAAISFSGYRVKNIAPPIVPNDAVNKAYFEEHVGVLTINGNIPDSDGNLIVPENVVLTINDDPPDGDGNIVLLLPNDIFKATTSEAKDWDSFEDAGQAACLFLSDSPNHPPVTSPFYGYNRTFGTSIVQTAVPQYVGNANVDKRIFQRGRYGGVWHDWRAISDGYDAATVGGLSVSDIQGLIDVSQINTNLAISGELSFGANTTAEFDTGLPAGGYLKIKVLLKCILDNEGFVIGDILNYEAYNHLFSVSEVQSSGTARVVRLLSKSGVHVILNPSYQWLNLQSRYSKWRVILIVERVSV